MKSSRGNEPFLLPEKKSRTRLVKILPVLIVCMFLQLISTKTFAQTALLTLEMKNVTVEEVLNVIESKTEYRFLYNKQLVDVTRKVTVVCEKSNVRQVLKKIFDGIGVSYSVNGKQIVLSKSESNSSSVDLKKIIGLVTDENGDPIIGASVMLKGEKIGTITNENGNFSLQASSQSSLVISYIGYQAREIKVDSHSPLLIKLTEKNKALDEVIVVGYGIQKKSDVTGAVSQIKMNSLESKQAVSLADYLRGAIAGLNISRSSSISGQTTIEIRGQTSLGTSTSPLIVVNGMIYNGLLNDINPNDIESVSVMKDASSAAVYGASAAAGVIIIKTKQGETEKPVIKLDLKTSVSQLFRRQDAYDVEGYLKMRADKLVTDKISNYNTPEYFSNPYKLSNVDLGTWMNYDKGVNPLSDPKEIWLNRLKLYPEEKTNYYNYNSIDWVDRVFRTGYMQDYNFSISGKSKTLNYYWSLGTLDNNGIVQNDNYKNIRSNINMTATITDFLEGGIKANLSTTNADGTPADWSVAYNNSPLGNFMNDDGTYVRYPNSDNMGKNPFDKTQWDTKDRNLNIMGVIFAKLKLPFGVTIETNFNNRWRGNQSYYYKPSWVIDGLASHGTGQRQEYNQYEWSLENILKWEKTFSDIHKIDLTLLQSAAKWTSSSTTAGASMFNTSEVLGYHLLDIGTVPQVSSNDQEDTRASYMGRLNYSLMSKYLLSLTFRRDGYSAFGQMNPWANFPAIATGWRISEEKFMKNINWLSNLKLRVSYGKNGNSNIGRYSALSQLSQNYYISDGTSTVTLYPSTMGNEQLKWEETLSTNIGLDLGLFDGRINCTIEAYNMNTTNMLMDRALPTLTGYTSVKSNLGEVNNKGIEVTLNTVNIKSPNFKWTSDFIFSMNRNTIVHLYGKMLNMADSLGNVTGQKEADDPTNGWYIGHSIDEIYGYKIIGVWQTSEAANALAQGRVPGDYKTYMDPSHTKLSSADYQWQGYLAPQYRLSMRNNISFLKSFNFSFLIRSDFGFKKAINEINVGGYADRVSQMKFPYWTESNPSDYWGRLGSQRTGTIYRDASFVRIEDASLNYEFPKELIKKISLQSARAFINVDNVYTFDSWLYWDPETKAPTPTTFTLGLSLTL